MSEYIVRGGIPLFGSVTVSGSKNSALPILFAAITVRGKSEIRNLPDIGDTRIAIEILRTLGATVTRDGDITTVDTECLTYADIPDSLISRLRASTYLLGALSVRFKRAAISAFGGCAFSHRPIDLHLAALRSFGSTISENGVTAERLTPAEISLPLPSVGATVNSLILASSIPGESRILGGAVEPHILDLVEYLRSAGAEIELRGSDYTVHGKELSSGSVCIRGDMIEAGTYLAAAIATGGRITVRGVDTRELASFVRPLAGSGVDFAITDSSITASGRPTSPIHVTTAPYPAFPTDLQPIIAPVISMVGGSITDTVWRSRFGYLDGLLRFGIYSRGRESRAEIFISEPHHATATAADLRGGVALTLAALMTEGESRIDNIELIERGYSDLTGSLARLGAEISRT